MSTPKTITDDHKAVLAKGRVETKAVRDYLNALARHTPKRGKQRTLKSVNGQLEDVETQLGQPDLDPVQRVLLTQARLDLSAERSMMEESRLESLEERFVAVALSYSQRNGLSWEAWRGALVPAPVLRRAGLSHTRSASPTPRR